MCDILPVRIRQLPHDMEENALWRALKRLGSGDLNAGSKVV